MSEHLPPARLYTRHDYQSMFGWGAVGGILPTLGKIAGAIGVHFEPPELSSFWGVIVALAIYAFIGSIIARAMGETEMKQALIAGIAAPAILTNVFNGATEGKLKLTDLFFISNAVAQSAGATTGVMEVGMTTHGTYRMVTLDPNVVGPGAITKPINVRIFSSSKDGKSRVVWYSGQLSDFTNNTTIAIPTSEAHIVVGDQLDLLVPESKDDVKVDLSLKSISGFSDGFLWALGGQPGINIQYKGTVSLTKPKDAKEPQ